MEAVWDAGPLHPGLHQESWESSALLCPSWWLPPALPGRVSGGCQGSSCSRAAATVEPSLLRMQAWAVSGCGCRAVQAVATLHEAPSCVCLAGTACHHRQSPGCITSTERGEQCPASICGPGQGQPLAWQGKGAGDGQGRGEDGCRRGGGDSRENRGLVARGEEAEGEEHPEVPEGRAQGWGLVLVAAH